MRLGNKKIKNAALECVYKKSFVFKIARNHRSVHEIGFMKTARGRRWMGVKRRKWEFLDASCVPAHTAEKKKQGKDCAMQRHEQVLPPCRCIAQIDPGESVPADAIACRWGVGGGGINKIGRGAHLSRRPLPSRFGASF